MYELILKGIVNTSIIVVGVLILSTTKYKLSIVLTAFVAAVFASSFAFNWGFQAGIITLFIVFVIVSRLTTDKWRYTFFILTNVVSLVIVSKYWSNFIAYHLLLAVNQTPTLDPYYYRLYIDDWYLPVSLLLQLVIAVGVFWLISKVFKGIGIHLFVDTLDRVYNRIMIIGLFIVQSFYILITILPEIISVYCISMITIQVIYTSILSVTTVVLLVLFRFMVKHQIELENKNATLEQVALQLAVVEKSLKMNQEALGETQRELNENEDLIQRAVDKIKEKERLLRFMDTQVGILSETRRKLLDFEHDQLNLIIALDGGIRSGDMQIMRESLDQYGAAVQEVLELKTNSLDLSNLCNSRLMAIRHLILTKAQLAIGQGARFTLEVPTEVTKIAMDLKDFTRILGIWLDNAIEEIIHVDDRWIHTSFIQTIDDDDTPILEVRVSNSCQPKKPVDIAKLHTQGFSSKTGENRGNGLRIVNEIMFKHDNIHIETRVKADDDKFTQFLSIASVES